jgi:hypothetical protein
VLRLRRLVFFNAPKVTFDVGRIVVPVHRHCQRIPNEKP